MHDAHRFAAHLQGHELTRLVLLTPFLLDLQKHEAQLGKVNEPNYLAALLPE